MATSPAISIKHAVTIVAKMTSHADQIITKRPAVTAAEIPVTLATKEKYTSKEQALTLPVPDETILLSKQSDKPVDIKAGTAVA